MKKLSVFVLLFLSIGLMGACRKEKAETTTAVVGDDVFQKSCISCHSSGDLSGGKIKLDSQKVHQDFKSEEDLFDFVHTYMPMNSPGSLSKKEYETVVHYLWNQK